MFRDKQADLNCDQEKSILLLFDPVNEKFT